MNRLVTRPTTSGWSGSAAAQFLANTLQDHVAIDGHPDGEDAAGNFWQRERADQECAWWVQGQPEKR